MKLIKNLNLFALMFSKNLDLSDRKSQKYYSLGTRFENAHYSSFRRLDKLVDLSSNIFDYFVDIGSGKGRVCFWAAIRTKVPKIIGIEANEELSNIANSNLEKLTLQNIEFFNVDARKFSLPRGNSIVFYFNSMPPQDFNQFLSNNQHLASRNIVLIFSVNDKLSNWETYLQKIWSDAASKSSLYRLIS